MVSKYYFHDELTFPAAILIKLAIEKVRLRYPGWTFAYERSRVEKPECDEYGHSDYAVLLVGHKPTNPGLFDPHLEKDFVVSYNIYSQGGIVDFPERVVEYREPPSFAESYTRGDKQNETDHA